MLEEYIYLMRRLEGGVVSKEVGSKNSVILIHGSMIADATSVLANFRSIDGSSDKARKSWKQANRYYQKTFKGWAKLGYPLYHPHVSSIVCGLARSLRETIKLDKAVQILEAVVMARQN